MLKNPYGGREKAVFRARVLRADEKRLCIIAMSYLF